MTFMDMCRHLALQESRAYRGWTNLGVPVPKHAPIDFAGEHHRITKHTNSTTRRSAA